MPANTAPIFALTAKVAAVTFINSDGTTAKTLLSAGTNGTKVLRIAVTSDDTAAVDMQLFIRISSVDYLVGTNDIPTLSGTDGSTDAVNLLDLAAMPWLDSDGEFFIPSGVDVKVAPLAAVTSAKTVTITAFAADY